MVGSVWLPFFVPSMEVNRANAASLDIFVQCLNNVSDPRSKQGVSQPFPTALAIVLLGLRANLAPFAEIQRWTEIHF